MVQPSIRRKQVNILKEKSLPAKTENIRAIECKEAAPYTVDLTRNKNIKKVAYGESIPQKKKSQITSKDQKSLDRLVKSIEVSQN